MYWQRSYVDVKASGEMSPAAALRQVQELVINKFAGKSVRIYEAGGGSLSMLPLSALDDPIVTVVDIDETQLANNSYADIKIFGDIQSYTFPPDSFDLIVCYNVIEHLHSVDQAICKFYNALAPGGILFIGAPNPASLLGLVTKYSPHWFHVWVYRVIFRYKDAGKAGHCPFRTVYHPIVSPKALLDFCMQIGFKVIYFNLYISINYTSLKEKRKVIGWLVGAAISLMNVLTFNRFDFAHGDYHVVLEKPFPSSMA